MTKSALLAALLALALTAMGEKDINPPQKDTQKPSS